MLLNLDKPFPVPLIRGYSDDKKVLFDNTAFLDAIGKHYLGDNAIDITEYITFKEWSKNIAPKLRINKTILDFMDKNQDYIFIEYKVKNMNSGKDETRTTTYEEWIKFSKEFTNKLPRFRTIAELYSTKISSKEELFFELKNFIENESSLAPIVKAIKEEEPVVFNELVNSLISNEIEKNINKNLQMKTTEEHIKTAMFLYSEKNVFLRLLKNKNYGGLSLFVQEKPYTVLNFLNDKEIVENISKETGTIIKNALKEVEPSVYKEEIDKINAIMGQKEKVSQKIPQKKTDKNKIKGPGE